MSPYKDYYKCLSVKENTKKNGENYLYLKISSLRFFYVSIDASNWCDWFPDSFNLETTNL